MVNEIKKDIRLSHSKVTTFDDCPFKYKLRYVDKIKNNYVPQQLLDGSAIHNIFDKVYLETETFLEFKNWLRGHKHYGKYKEQIENFIKYNDKLYLKYFQYRPLHTELRIFDEKWNVIGIIDRVDKLDGKIVVTDYKTGKFHPITNYDIQLGTYKKLLKDKMGINVDVYSIYFSKDNRILLEDADNNWEAKAEMFFNSIRNKIKLKMEQDNPIWNKSGKWCKWCEFYPKHCKGKNSL